MIFRNYVHHRMGYQSTRHTLMSSHGQLVTQASRHTVNSSQLTSEHITKPPVVIFFYLHAGHVAPRNSAQHGRHTYGKRAISKSLTMAKLLNGMNARSKRTVISSQHHQTRRSARHTILRCELTVWRVHWFPQDDSSKLYSYADDAKIFKVVSQKTGQLDLQAIMNTVKTWSDEWLLRLNIDKCKTVSYYLKYPPLDTQYHIVDGNTTYILEQELVRRWDTQGRIMVPRGPEAWKRLRAPQTYLQIAILTLF